MYMCTNSTCIKTTFNYHNYQNYKRGGVVWVQLLGGEGTSARVILGLRECIWNAPKVSAFDDTGSMGSPPGQVFYPPG